MALNYQFDNFQELELRAGHCQAQSFSCFQMQYHTDFIPVFDFSIAIYICPGERIASARRV